MNSAMRKAVGSLTMVLVLTLGTAIADEYKIAWWAVDGGGGETDSSAVDGEYELTGSIGRPDAGDMSGGPYRVTGGFWFPFDSADCDADDDTDLEDYYTLEACLLGPGAGVSEFCECHDITGDDDVDLGDFARLQVSLVVNH